MSLNPYYADASILMTAAARAQGGIDVFVNISEFEQSFMTFDRMTAPRDPRIAWLGGLVAEWSPQQRAHWVSEEALKWSGLPVVNIRATMFADSCSSRPLERDDVARRNGMMPPTITR
jgi:uncharacterized protein YbjT (DUF2867 family)